MVDWHDSNETMAAQQFQSTVIPIENNFVGPLLGGSGLATDSKFTAAQPEVSVVDD